MDGAALKKLTVSGSPISNISETCISASLKVSTSQVSTMTFLFNDTLTLQLFRSGSLKGGTSIRYGDWAVTVDTQKVQPGKAGPQVQVTAYSSFVTKLRNQTGAKNWGNQDVSAWVNSQINAVGARALVQSGMGKQEIMREKPSGTSRQSTWDVMTNLARQQGAWLFEYGDRIVFGRPTWFMEREARSIWALEWNSWSDYSDAMSGLPKYTSGTEGKSDEKLTVSLVAANGDTIRPGDEVKLSGNVGSMGGRWLVVSCTYPLTVNGTVTVDCERPVNPEKQAVVGAKKTASAKRVEAKGKAKPAPAAKKASSWFTNWLRTHVGGKWGVETYGVQCVGLAKQYAKDLYGVWPRGNGKDWYYGSVQRQHFTPIGRGSKAQPGDIACWGAALGGGYGHVAIVVEDRGSSVYCLSQSGTTHRAAYYATFSKSGLQGYLRPKGGKV